MIMMLMMKGETKTGVTFIMIIINVIAVNIKISYTSPVLNMTRLLYDQPLYMSNFVHVQSCI